MLLPIDEDPFEINADTRTVKIPTSFSKCASVQEDANAEMIVFTIDRFFDFTDLDTCQICVQWITPEGKEGLSLIDVRDLETFPGKIRFGWLLTSALTEAAGKIKFAVRFFKKAADDSYTYVFNTLPAEIIIKEGLEFDETEGANNQDVSATTLFKQFITNSQNPSYPIPQSPYYAAPGLDLPAAASLVDNTLTLKAQAITSDLGNIAYAWYYTPSGTTVSTQVEGTDVYEEVNPTSRVKGDVYYTKVGSDDALAYELYTGDIPTTDGTQLYERYTTFTIPDGTEEVVGRYRVEATNTVGDVTLGANTSNPVPSTTCVLPAPAPVQIETDLPTHKFLDSKTNMAALGVGLATDSANPVHSYSWSYSDTDATLQTDVESKGTAFSIDADAAGWYQLTVTASLNRKEEVGKSIICRVTALPKAPVPVLYYKVADALEFEPVTEDVDTTKDNPLGTLVTLKVETGLENATALESDKVEYIWQVQTADGSFRDIDVLDAENDGILAGGLGTSELIVRTQVNSYNYRCVVKNTIEKETVEATTPVSFTVV